MKNGGRPFPFQNPFSFFWQPCSNPLPGPTTREHRKLIGVMTMYLGINYSFYCLMCCPSTKVLTNDSKRFTSYYWHYWRVTQRQTTRHFVTRKAATNIKPRSTLLQARQRLCSIYREEPRSTRIVVAYPRLAFVLSNKADKLRSNQF